MILDLAALGFRGERRRSREKGDAMSREGNEGMRELRLGGGVDRLE
jgi:hypothetical protein